MFNYTSHAFSTDVTDEFSININEVVLAPLRIHESVMMDPEMKI
jgi:hypothetical protein